MNEFGAVVVLWDDAEHGGEGLHSPQFLEPLEPKVGDTVRRVPEVPGFPDLGVVEAVGVGYLEDFCRVRWGDERGTIVHYRSVLRVVASLEQKPAEAVKWREGMRVRHRRDGITGTVRCVYSDPDSSEGGGAPWRFDGVTVEWDNPRGSGVCDYWIDDREDGGSIAQLEPLPKLHESEPRRSAPACVTSARVPWHGLELSPLQERARTELCVGDRVHASGGHGSGWGLVDEVTPEGFKLGALWFGWHELEAWERFRGEAPAPLSWRKGARVRDKSPANRGHGTIDDLWSRPGAPSLADASAMVAWDVGLPGMRRVADLELLTDALDRVVERSRELADQALAELTPKERTLIEGLNARKFAKGARVEILPGPLVQLDGHLYRSEVAGLTGVVLSFEPMGEGNPLGDIARVALEGGNERLWVVPERMRLLEPAPNPDALYSENPDGSLSCNPEVFGAAHRVRVAGGRSGAGARAATSLRQATQQLSIASIAAQEHGPNELAVVGFRALFERAQELAGVLERLLTAIDEPDSADSITAASMVPREDESWRSWPARCVERRGSFARFDADHSAGKGVWFDLNTARALLVDSLDLDCVEEK